MTRRATLTQMVILLVLVLASIACSLGRTGSSSSSDDTSSTKALSSTIELTAQEILDKSTEAMKAVKTMSLLMNVTSGSSGISIEINGEGIVEQPDKTYILVDFAGHTIEMLMLSKTEAYTKQPGSTIWEPVPVEQLSQPKGLVGMNMDVIQQLGIIGFANEVSLAGTETVEGIVCYHIAFSLDMGKYLAQLGETGAQLDAATAKGTGDLWIGTDDFLTRKFIFKLDASSQGVSINASTTLTLTKFNEPVEFPSP